MVLLGISDKRPGSVVISFRAFTLCRLTARDR
jgi:hypothetical protein